jgi:predicted MPP superfamily phosphohydrolase
MRIIFFITFFLIYLGANFYVCRRIVQLLPVGNISLRIVVIGLFLIATLSMFVFFLWGEKIPVFWASFFYTLGVSWLIAFLYLLIAFLLIDAVKLLNMFVNFMDKEVVYRLTHANWKTLAVVLGSITLLLIYANRVYENKVRVHLVIETEKWNENDRPIRIVGISDVHLGYTINRRELRQWVDLINAEDPDIVLIAGDFIDNSIRPLDHFRLDAKLREINAPMGVFACAGNHEYIADINNVIDFFKRSNITLLRDSVAVLENLQIIGRDDITRRNRKSIEQLTAGLDMSKFTILLDHQPTNLDDAIRGNVDFQFSGHTHGGQVFPITLIVNRMFELSHGHLKRDGTHFYVSSGLGIWGGKFRLGTQSEFVVIDIKPSSQTDAGEKSKI